MSDVRDLAIRDGFNLPDAQIKELTTVLTRRGISYLSPDKEEGPFLLYCMGDDAQAIALKTNYPVDVILMTAIRYDWKTKAAVLNKVRDKTPQDIQKDLANTLLLTTYVALKKEMAEVVSGKKDPNKSTLIPKSAKALTELMDLVNKVNGYQPPDASNPPAPGATVVHANNVQINQGVEPPKQIEESEEDKMKRAIKIKALES